MKKKNIFDYNSKLEMRVAEKNKGFMPMCGWHPNYFDFTYGKVKGTATLIHGGLVITINHQYSFRMDCTDAVKAAIKEMKLHQRKNKGS